MDVPPGVACLDTRHPRRLLAPEQVPMRFSIYDRPSTNLVSATAGCRRRSRALEPRCGVLPIYAPLGNLQGSTWRPEWFAEVTKVGDDDQHDGRLFRIALPLTVSPECIETAFCELRLYGVLRSSAKGGAKKLSVLSKSSLYPLTAPRQL